MDVTSKQQTSSEEIGCGYVPMIVLEMFFVEQNALHNVCNTLVSLRRSLFRHQAILYIAYYFLGLFYFLSRHQAILYFGMVRVDMCGTEWSSSLVSGI